MIRQFWTFSYYLIRQFEIFSCYLIRQFEIFSCYLIRLFEIFSYYCSFSVTGRFVFWSSPTKYFALLLFLLAMALPVLVDRADAQSTAQAGKAPTKTSTAAAKPAAAPTKTSTAAAKPAAAPAKTSTAAAKPGLASTKTSTAAAIPAPVLQSGANGREKGGSISVSADTVDLVNQAKDLVHEYKYSEAESLLNEAVKREPKNGRYHFLLGKTLIEEGRFEKAIDEFLEAGLLQPDNNDSRFEIAQIYVYQGRFKDAASVLEQIKKRVPFISRDARKVERALASIASYYELGDPNSVSYANADESIPWQRADFPIKVAIWSDPEMKDLKAPFRQAVIDAFARWKEASGGWLSFQIVDEQRQAKIVCKLVGVMRGSKYAGGGEKLGETLGDYDTKNTDNRGFSRVEIFWDEDSNPAHLRATVVHEVGHALGLEHSNNPLDVMYPFVHPPYTEFPSRRDAASLKALYKIKS